MLRRIREAARGDRDGGAAGGSHPGHGGDEHRLPPHVFVDYTAALAFAGEHLEGFRVGWLLDELFSRAILQEFDADGDRTLSARAVQRIEQKHRAELRATG